jgi:hypothetical protein
MVVFASRKPTIGWSTWPLSDETTFIQYNVGKANAVTGSVPNTSKSTTIADMILLIFIKFSPYSKSTE